MGDHQAIDAVADSDNCRTENGGGFDHPVALMESGKESHRTDYREARGDLLPRRSVSTVTLAHGGTLDAWLLLSAHGKKQHPRVG